MLVCKFHKLHFTCKILKNLCIIQINTLKIPVAYDGNVLKDYQSTVRLAYLILISFAKQ